MSKELEALEELRYGKEYIKGTDVEEGLFTIIEKGIKGLDAIKETFDFSVELGSCPDGTITYKLNVWCKGTPTVVKPISKETYDLLKEILL